MDGRNAGALVALKARNSAGFVSGVSGGKTQGSITEWEWESFYGRQKDAKEAWASRRAAKR